MLRTPFPTPTMHLRTIPTVCRQRAVSKPLPLPLPLPSPSPHWCPFLRCVRLTPTAFPSSVLFSLQSLCLARSMVKPIFTITYALIVVPLVTVGLTAITRAPVHSHRDRRGIRFFQQRIRRTGLVHQQQQGSTSVRIRGYTRNAVPCSQLSAVDVTKFKCSTFEFVKRIR